MWSSIEGTLSGDFKIQYMESSTWKDHVSFSPSSLSKSKYLPDNYEILLPKNVNRIRFIATHDQPSGNQNKGRIVLDNIIMKYN